MPERWIPSLEDYIDVAAFLLGADRTAVQALPRLTLAESALHAPFASFGGVEAYPTLIEQAAVLIEHLARNHPLPDANKRAAFLLTARFLDANGLPGHAQRGHRRDDGRTHRCRQRRARRRPRVGPPTNRAELISRPLGEARCCRRPSPSPVGLWRGGRLVAARCTALAA